MAVGCLAGDASPRVLSASCVALLLMALLVAARPAGADPAPRDSTPAAARFVGPYAWVRLDPDSSGLADQLRFAGFVEVRCPPRDSVDLHVNVGLYRDSTFITFQPGDRYESTYDWRGLGGHPTGRFPFRVDFGGEDIRRGEADGPYTVRLDLRPSSRFGGPPLDRLLQDSPPYSWREFAEYGVRTREASEQPVDTDGDGLYDSIRVTVRLEVAPLRAWPISVYVSGREWQTEGVDEAHGVVPAGCTTAEMALDASEFRRLGKNGPYTLDLSVSGVPLRTRPYRVTQLAYPPLCLLEGALHSTGTDPDRSGGFTMLTIPVPVEVRHAGRFTCSGVVRTGTHEAKSIFWSDSLARGRHEIPLRFPACRDWLTGQVLLESLQIEAACGTNFRPMVEASEPRPAGQVSATSFAPCRPGW